jgi:hypothetical protein
MRIITLILLSISLYGHSLKIFVDENNSKIDIKTTLHIASFYKKNSPCIECNVKITQDNKVVEKTTDQNGIVTYTPISNNPITIETDAGAGHYKKIEYTPHTKIEVKDEIDIQKIILSLVLIFFIFFILKRVKK